MRLDPFGLTELAFIGTALMVGAGGFLSCKFGRRVLISGVLVLISGFLVFVILLGLAQFHFLGYPGSSMPILGLSLVLCHLGVGTLLGYGIQRAASGGRFSWKLVVYSLLVSLTLVALSMTKMGYVERHRFDPSASPAASDYVPAYGWPIKFLGDLPEKENLSRLPGDTILFPSLVSDFLFTLCFVLLLFFNIKRYAWAR